MSSDHNGNNNKNSSEKDKLLDHDYDGIKEQDNPLPGWWLATFYLTIAFGAAYYIYYELAGGPSSVEELASDIESTKLEAKSKQSPLPEITPEAILATVSSNSAHTVGKTAYQERCSTCHGDKGQGGIGPNLTDKFWIHGGGTLDIYNSISKGVLDKGMPAWSALLKPEELSAVAGYVITLKGTTPSGAKAPQGVEYKE